MAKASLPQRRWLICYDMGSPRRRRQVVRLLEAEGHRVQYSVFQIEATAHQVMRLCKVCRARMAATDKLVAWCVSPPLATPWAPRPAPGLPAYWVA